MFLRYMSDEELKQYAERVSKWLNQTEKAEIAAEFERRCPGGAERIKEARRKAQRKALGEQWRQNGCVQDPLGNWIVPDELMWRSLPRGEDR